MTAPVAEGRRRARALTVFQSPKIERFDVELIGDLPDGGIAGIDLILGRAYGPKIDELGGVPAGASGSPVYVGERLIGAVAYVLSPDFRLVGITPIEAMRRLALEPGLRATSGGLTPRATAAPREERTAGDRSGERRHLSSPAWPAGMAPAVGGFRSPRSWRVLRERFAIEPIPVTPFAPPVSSVPFSAPGLTPAPPVASTPTSTPPPTSPSPLAPPAAADAPARPVAPGSPIGISLIDGDLRLGPIGTATSVEGQTVLGLGHPAFFAGAVRLPLHEAIIVTTAGGEGPVKVGYIGRTVGVVTQDRAAGILGELGATPERVELVADVTDTDRHVREVLRVGLAPLSAWIPTLVFVATVEAFARAMNRVGPGEAAWTWTVELEGAPEPVRREGTERSPFDVGGAVARAGEELLAELVQEGAEIRRITLQARVHL